VLCVAWVVALLGAAVFKLLPGMDPDSLFLDDQWVGIVVRDVGFLERLALHPPMPVGFALLEGFPAASSRIQRSRSRSYPCWRTWRRWRSSRFSSIA
jgi:hypothetical protein